MIDLIWAVLCSQSSIDQETNNISLIEVLERIVVEATPPDQESIMIPITSVLVALSTRSILDQPAQGEGRIRLTSPTGDLIRTVEFPIDLTAHTRTRSRLKAFGLEIRSAGYYYFNVDLRQEGQDDWQQVAQIPLEVAFVAQQEQTHEH